MDIVAEIRTDVGRNCNSKLRKKLKVPAVIYFSGLSIPIFFDEFYSTDIISNFNRGKNFFDILIGDKKYSVILKDFYNHPYKNCILHFDFQKVELNDVINTKVFFKFIGEKTSIGIKHGGFLIKHKLSLDIKCVRSKMPNFIEVDVTDLGVNKSVFLSDLFIPDFINIPLLNRFKGRVLIASILGPRAAEQKVLEKKVLEKKVLETKTNK
ncbi:50S ribosomal protein L25 [Candidatus Azoamicus ciliaticola]|nr:50S ribosomal protein L25 [Candidatus Azoamicus ciliaticola]